MARIASDWLVLCAEPLIKARRDEFGDHLFDIGAVRLVRIADVQRTKSDEVSGYIEVQSGNAHIYQSRINLLSSSQQDTLCRTLKRRDNFSGWEAVMHLCFLHVIKTEQKACDFALIDDVPPGESFGYAIDPILMADTVTVLAGDGGSGKSLFSLALGMIIISGTELVSGLKPGRMGPVLYLDWEDSAGEISYRYHALKRGFGEENVGQGLYYQRMTQPLHLVKQDLLRMVRRYEPELIIVDSFSMASGGEPEKADSAIRVFDVLRALASTALVISHISKAEQGLKRPSPYGSIHVATQARSVLIQKRVDEEQEDEIVFTVANTKNNRERRGRLWGFRLRFEDDAIKLNRVHSNDLVLLEGMTLSQQLRALLKQPMSIEQIVEELPDANQGSIQNTLYRLRRKGLVAKTANGWCLTERN